MERKVSSECWQSRLSNHVKIFANPYARFFFQSKALASAGFQISSSGRGQRQILYHVTKKEQLVKDLEQASIVNMLLDDEDHFASDDSGNSEEDYSDYRISSGTDDDDEEGQRMDLDEDPTSPSFQLELLDSVRYTEPREAVPRSRDYFINVFSGS